MISSTKSRSPIYNISSSSINGTNYIHNPFTQLKCKSPVRELLYVDPCNLFYSLFLYLFIE